MTLLDNYDPLHVHLTATEYEVAHAVGVRRATSIWDPHLSGGLSADVIRDHVDAAVAECAVAKCLGTYWMGAMGSTGHGCSGGAGFVGADVAPNIRVCHLRDGAVELAVRPAEFAPGQVLIGAHVIPENVTTVVLLGCFDLDLLRGSSADRPAEEPDVRPARDDGQDAVSLRYLFPMAALLTHGPRFGVMAVEDIDDF
jgi:hypothetical protein